MVKTRGGAKSVAGSDESPKTNKTKRIVPRGPRTPPTFATRRSTVADVYVRVPAVEQRLRDSRISDRIGRAAPVHAAAVVQAVLHEVLLHGALHAAKSNRKTLEVDDIAAAFRDVTHLATIDLGMRDGIAFASVPSASIQRVRRVRSAAPAAAASAAVAATT